MKWLALLSIAFFLTSPALAADLDYPRYGRPKVYTERSPRVVECRYYPTVPSALYDKLDVGQFNSKVWRPLPRYCAYTDWRPHRHHHWQTNIAGR